MRKLTILLGILILWAGTAAAQTVRTIAVSDGHSYTDHIALAGDSRDTDVMVKFIFDEPNNTLTVSVLSYRRLFVFREDARYKSVVRCRHLRPEQLPYVVANDPKGSFKLSKAVRKAIPAPRCKHIFKRWISYEGLQPAPSEYKMVNDYIEQVFDIQGKRTAVTVTLRDLFLLDVDGKKANSYVLSLGRDLNLKYQIAIVRNACLGMDEQIEAARKDRDEVQKAYKGFRQNYAKGEVTDAAALKTFEETRTMLLTRYTAKDAQASCPTLATLLQQYNQYVDSIGKVNCRLVLPQEAAWDDGKPLDVKLVYTQTRQLDKAVARWLVSKDPLERSDLIAQCKDIVTDMEAMLRQHKVTTAEEQKAVQAYRQAEQYFRKTCKQ